MPRQKSDKAFKAKYGGAGAVGDVTGKRTAHDTFMDVMSGQKKTVAEWRKEVAPMKERAKKFREAHANKVRWGR